MSRELGVLATGPLALVEDLGRPGLAASGVPRSGAADRRALRLANRLVANPVDAAGIEVLFGGLVVRAAQVNVARFAEHTIREGDRVWLGFAPSAGVGLRD